MSRHNFCAVGAFDSIGNEHSLKLLLGTAVSSGRRLSFKLPHWASTPHELPHFFSWLFAASGLPCDILMVLPVWAVHERAERKSSHLFSYLILEGRSESLTLTHTQEVIRTWIPGCAIIRSRLKVALENLGSRVISWAAVSPTGIKPAA